MDESAIERRIDELYGALLMERLDNVKLRDTNRELRRELAKRLQDQTGVVRNVLRRVVKPGLGRELPGSV